MGHGTEKGGSARAKEVKLLSQPLHLSNILKANTAWWDWGVAEWKMGFSCCLWLPTMPAVSFCLTNWANLPVLWGPVTAAPIHGPWWYHIRHWVLSLALKPCGERRCVWCGLGLWMPAASALILTTTSNMIWCAGPKHVFSYSVLHAHVKQIWEPASVWPIIFAPLQSVY